MSVTCEVPAIAPARCLIISYRQMISLLLTIFLIGYIIIGALHLIHLLTELQLGIIAEGGFAWSILKVHLLMFHPSFCCIVARQQIFCNVLSSEVVERYFLQVLCGKIKLTQTHIFCSDEIIEIILIKIETIDDPLFEFIGRSVFDILIVVN